MRLFLYIIVGLNFSVYLCCVIILELFLWNMKFSVRFIMVYEYIIIYVCDIEIWYLKFRIILIIM